MELQFLGWKFMLLRLGLTIAVLIPMALLAEVLYHRGERAAEPFAEEEVEMVEESLGIKAPARGRRKRRHDPMVDDGTGPWSRRGLVKRYGKFTAGTTCG